jgi:hypothetical protein
LTLTYNIRQAPLGICFSGSCLLPNCIRTCIGLSFPHIYSLSDFVLFVDTTFKIMRYIANRHCLNFEIQVLKTNCIICIRQYNPSEARKAGQNPHQIDQLNCCPIGILACEIFQFLWVHNMTMTKALGEEIMCQFKDVLDFQCF